LLEICIIIVLEHGYIIRVEEMPLAMEIIPLPCALIGHLTIRVVENAKAIILI